MTRKADAWMPFYVADYLKDTMHLTTEQHGAYMLLLMACWNGGGSLPADDAQLAGIARLGRTEWRRMAPIIRRFFSAEGGKLTHKRVSAEFDKAQRLSEKRKEIGGLGGRPRKGQTKPKPIGFDLHNQLGEQNETPSPITSEVEAKAPTSDLSDANASSVGSPGFEVQTAIDHWNAVAARCGLPQAKGCNKARRAAIKARLKEAGFDGWTEACAGVERSKTCRGMTDIGFRADIDFVASPSKFQRLREGFYDSDAAPVAATLPDQPAVSFRGPDVVRQALVDRIGEEAVRSYVDPGRWEEGIRTLWVSGPTTRDRLIGLLGAWAAHGKIKVEVEARATTNPKMLGAPA